VADALEDDEAAGPAFDPFSHKLVLATMADYLERIAATKREIARLKGEKEAFEQSNAPEDLDEEELAAWNYPKDLERQRKEIKTEHREALADLAKKNKAASLIKATANQKKAAEAAKLALRPLLDQLDAIDAALAPYGEIKDQLASSRAAYRKLLNDFVEVLKNRCADLKDKDCQQLVLRLLAGDVRQALESALNSKRQELVRFLEGLWDKYAVTLEKLREERGELEGTLNTSMASLNYD
jgi:type I restriction enzyme M protein